MPELRIANATPGLPPAPPFLSSAIRHGDYVFASGQIVTAPDGRMRDGPIQNRVDQIIDNLAAVLSAHGTSLANIVKCNIFITTYDNFAAINEAYVRRMPTPAPARSCIGVASLPFGTDVEIECIAAVQRVAKL